MYNNDLQENVTQLNTTVYGVHGRGGLVNEVERIREQVNEQERRLDTVSAKWLILMFVASLIGNTAGASILKTLNFFQ